MNLAASSLISFILLTFSYQVSSENRNYQYAIINKHFTNKGQRKTNIIIETLPPTAYTSKHGIENSTGEILLRTWLCPGVTGRLKTCKPKKIFKN